MDKQIGEVNEMVEEIEQFLARKILGGKAWNTRDIAEGVYELITENAVVLTREEYERLLKEETLCERLGNDIDVKLKYIYELEDKVAQERKETAEKFAERAKELLDKQKKGWSANMIWIITAKNCIDEIFKEITEGTE